MIGYIVVYFVTIMPGLLNRIQEALDPRSIFILFLIETCFTSSQGWLNSLVYGFRESVRKEISCCLKEKNKEKQLIQTY
jgi:hypothetical protein